MRGVRSITHRLTQPRSPTTTGKIERFHQTLCRELLDEEVRTIRRTTTKPVRTIKAARPFQRTSVS